MPYTSNRRPNYHFALIGTHSSLYGKVGYENLVTSRAGSGKTTLAAELASRGLAAYVTATFIPNLCLLARPCHRPKSSQELPLPITARRKVRLVLGTGSYGPPSSAAPDVIPCGSADNMADFYPAFDKRFILNVEPWSSYIACKTEAHGYAKDDPGLQRKSLKSKRS